MRPLVPAPSYDVDIFPSPRNGRDARPPRSPLGFVAVVLLVGSLGSAFWLWRPGTPPAAPREPTVALPERAVRELTLQLENARRLNADAIAEMSKVQTLIRQIAPYFRNNGFETNNRRAVEIDNRALSAMRLSNQSTDELTLALDQLMKENTQ